MKQPDGTFRVIASMESLVKLSGKVYDSALIIRVTDNVA